MKTSELRELIRETIKEANFDKRLAQQMGMSDDEFEKNIASRDIGSSFPDTDVMNDFDEDDVRSIEDKAMKSDSQRYMVDIILPIDVPKTGDDYKDEKIAEKITDFYRKKMGYPEAYTGKAEKRLR
tara:strand:- start:35 stop:412 length:378 start_codon:yes stop_codon:yes gene_type:complete